MTEPAPTETKKPGFFYGYTIVICSFFIVFFILIANSSFGVFFKPVSEQFDWNRAQTSLAFSISQLMGGLSGVFMGFLTDRIGPRIVLTISGILVGAGFLLMSQINNLWQLYFFFGIIVGIGMGGGYVPPLSTVARWFTARRSLMSGIVLVGLSTATLVAPPVAERLIAAFNWQTSYFIIGAVVLVAVIITAQFMKRDPSTMKLKPYGADSEIHAHEHGRGLTLKESLRTIQFWIMVIIEFVFGFIMFTLFVHLVPHVDDMIDNLTIAAIVLAVAGLFSIPGRLVLGHIADRIGNKNIFFIGFLLMALSAFWLIFINDILALYAFAAVFGFAYGGIESSESPIVANLFGLKSHGAIFGVLAMCFTLGSAAGPFIAGYIFDTYGSYQMAFIIMAALGLLGTILILALKPISSRVK